MPPFPIDADAATRALAALAGGALLYGAGKAAALAHLHMALMGHLCGAGLESPHCVWCAAAVAAGLASVAAFGVAIRPDRRAAATVEAEA